MKKVRSVILCALLLIFAPTLAAEQRNKLPNQATPANQVATQVSDTSTDLKLQQQKLDFFKERLDQQDKRIGDIALYLACFGALMTVIVVFFSLRSKSEAVLEAKSEARNEIEKQAQQMVDDILTPQIEKALGEIRQAADGVIKGLEEEQRKAQDQNKKQKELNEQHEKALSGLSQPPRLYRFGDWLTQGVQAFQAAKYEAAADHFTKAEEVAGNAIEETMALVNKGITLVQMGQNEAAIAVYEDVVRRFGDATESAVREQVAKAYVNQGYTLDKMGRREQAISVYDDLLRRFGEVTETALSVQVANALLNKGYSLDQIGQREAAISVYDELLRRFGEVTGAELREHVARALGARGYLLVQSKRLDEGVAAYDELTRRFGDATELVVREQVALALANKGFALNIMGRKNDSIAVYDEVVRRFGTAPEFAIQGVVANAINGIGFALMCDAKKIWKDGDGSGAEGLLKQALEKINAALQRRPDNPLILGNQGYILYLLGRREEARQILSKAIALGGEGLRKAELADADIHSLPQDEEFRTLIKSL